MLTTHIHPALPRIGGWNTLAAPPRTAKTRSSVEVQICDTRKLSLDRPLHAARTAGNTAAAPPGEGGGGGGDIMPAHLWLGRPRTTSEGGLRPSRPAESLGKTVF